MCDLCQDSGATAVVTVMVRHKLTEIVEHKSELVHCKYNARQGEIGEITILCKATLRYRGMSGARSELLKFEKQHVGGIQIM